MLALKNAMYNETLISKILEFQKAGSTTSRYLSMDHKTGFRFPLSQK